MSLMVPDDAPRPRLAHVTKSPDFVGYGFNLHAEKGKAGQFIGDVDAGSPAATAGLRSGDRIIEVNGTNIANENHQQVVQRVKAIANETKLLVVDAETDKYYREKKIVIRGDMPNVLRFPAAGDYNDGTSQPADDTPMNNNITEAVNQTPDNSVQVRLCHLAISPDFDGYGFNLHSEKGKAGQFIGTIDPGSPAEAAGLHEGDRIIEVNDVPINNDEHKHVVQKIKLIQNKTKLLVVDAETARWYKQQNIPISSTTPNIKVMGSVTSELVTENDVFTEAEMNHSSSTNQVNEVDVNSLESPEPIEASEPFEDNPEERMNGDAIVEHEANRVEDVPPPVEDIDPPVEDVAPIENHYTEEEETPPPEPEPQAPVVTEIEPMPASPSSSSQNSYTDTRSPAPVQSDSSSSGAVEGELFGMSVKEARARIGGRKKRNEVKQSGMSSKAKYDLFQKL